MLTRAEETRQRLAALRRDIQTSRAHLERRKKDVEVWTRHIAGLEHRELQLLAELERENAPLVRPEGKCVTLEQNGVEWKV